MKRKLSELEEKQSKDLQSKNLQEPLQEQLQEQSVKKAKMSLNTTTIATIEIKDIFHFGRVMEVLSKQKANITFYIIYSPTFIGLEIVTMNDGHVCMIEGRFACSVILNNDNNNETNKNFSVNIKMLQSTLLSSYINIWHIEETVLRCELVSNDHRKILGNNNDSIRISGANIHVPLLQADYEELPHFRDNTYQYAILLDQSTLRTQLYLLLISEISSVSFIVYKYSETAVYFVVYGENTSSQDAEFYYYGILQNHNENPNETSSHRFPLITKQWIDISSSNLLGQQPLQSSVRAAEISNPSASLDWSSMKKLYEGHFSIKFIEPFIKNLDHTNMFFYLSNNMPLVIHFQVRNTTTENNNNYSTTDPSYLRYYVAPLNTT